MVKLSELIPELNSTSKIELSPEFLENSLSLVELVAACPVNGTQGSEVVNFLGFSNNFPNNGFGNFTRKLDNALHASGLDLTLNQVLRRRTRSAGRPWFPGPKINEGHTFLKMLLERHQEQDRTT